MKVKIQSVGSTMEPKAIGRITDEQGTTIGYIKKVKKEILITFRPVNITLEANFFTELTDFLLKYSFNKILIDGCKN